MPGVLVISKETIDSFVEDLSNNESNVTTRKKDPDPNDSMTTISANRKLHSAYEEQNDLIKLIKDATVQEEANLLMIANDFTEFDEDVSDGF